MAVASGIQDASDLGLDIVGVDDVGYRPEAQFSSLFAFQKGSGNSSAVGSLLGEFARPGYLDFWWISSPDVVNELDPESYIYSGSEWFLLLDSISTNSGMGVDDNIAGVLDFGDSLPRGRQWQLRWFAERIQIGLRLFWHNRGRQRHLLLFLMLLRSSLSYPCSAPYAEGFATLLCWSVELFARSFESALMPARVLSSASSLVFTYPPFRQPWRRLSFSPTALRGCGTLIGLLVASIFSGLVVAYFSTNVSVPDSLMLSWRNYWHPSNILLPGIINGAWVQKSFDSTLGFPGEGPCSLCGETSHNVRTCPHVPVDVADNDSSSASQNPVVRNTFVDFDVPATERARTLRAHSTEGDVSSAPP